MHEHGRLGALPRREGAVSGGDAKNLGGRSAFDALDEVELTLDALAATWTDADDALVPRSTLRGRPARPCEVSASEPRPDVGELIAERAAS